MKLSLPSVLSEGFRDFRRCWPQLVRADLLARLLGVVVLAPALGVLLKIFLATTATGVVTDEAIVSFLIHPMGAAALLVVGAVSAGVLFAENGQLMVIGFGAAGGQHLTWWQALLYAVRHAASLVELAAHAVARLLLVSLPFLAAMGGVYWLLVRTHDINYYLALRPPVFILALAAAGLLFAGLGLLILVKIAGWLLSVPMVLFEGMGGAEALRESDRVVRGSRRRLALWLIGWLASVAGLAALTTFLVGLSGDLLVPRESSNLNVILAGLSLVIVISGLANLAVSVFTTTLFPVLLARLYRSVGRPGVLQTRGALRATAVGSSAPRVRGWAVAAAAAAVLLAVVVGALIAVDDVEWADRAEVVAHRGGAAVAPENTMAAFGRAIRDGTDWIELDVQENADGEVVVAHDRDFMRLAGVQLEVWEATNDQLASLDVGSSFRPEFVDQRVPTLRQVLELARDRAGVFIELKYYGRNVSLEQRVADVVEEVGTADQVAIMSLSYDGLRRMAALRPDWTHGLLNAVAVGELTRLEVDFLAVTARAASISTIRRAHRRGTKVYAWTIDDPVQMWVMMSRGVDGIITDRVATARRVKELRAQVTPLGRWIIWLAGESGLLRGMEEASGEDDA